MTGRRTAPDILSLDVLLQDMKVGTIVRVPNGMNLFSFTPEYRALPAAPVLSLSFKSATGGLRKDPGPILGELPPFFANLLPEDKLREAMEKHHSDSVRPGNDFDLLAALGTDLPGAVRAIPSYGFDAPSPPEIRRDRKARFSLAGVQMKLSVMKNAGKKGGITLPVGDESGEYIAKFPSVRHIGLSENEFAMLALAEAVGMDVPERELVEPAEFAGIPEEFNVMSTGKVLLVRRFDRARGSRIHMEDFCQVFGRPPLHKYDGAAYHDIAAVLQQAVSFDAAIEFVRRLALCVLTGNGDMHLKNWSVTYPGDGKRPALAPVYDMLSTVAYIPSESLALSLAGTRSFKALTRDRWRNFASRAKLPEGAVEMAVAETVAAVQEHWWALPEREVVPAGVLEQIDQHIKIMSVALAPDRESSSHPHP